jgi:peptidoglycan hydrolase-like protein with peptidoglycan-binding domain
MGRETEAKMVRTKHVMSALLVVVLGMVHQPISQAAADVSWTEVKLADARAHLSSLDAETQVEQLRDWALLAAYMQTEDPAERPNGLLAFEPLRLDFLGDLVSHRAGAERWITLHGGELLAVLPETTSDRLVEIGHLADEYRALHGAVPKRVFAFLYRLDVVTPRLDIGRLEEIAGARLFSAEAGYREMHLDTSAQIDAFLAANLDLVSFRLDGGGARVGGRTSTPGLPRMVTLADLAILADADRNLVTRVRAQLEKRGLREDYETRVAKVVMALRAEKPAEVAGVSPAELATQVRLAVPYLAFVQKEIDEVMRDQPPSLGFSLDPRVNYPEIAATLRAITRGERTANEWYTAHLRQAAEKILVFEQEQGDELLEVFRKAAAAQTPTIVDRDTSLASLLQLPSASLAVTTAATAASPVNNRSRSLEDPQVIAERMDALAASAATALRKRASELDRIATSLDAQDIGPLLDLRRYLEGDVAASAIDATAPRERIQDVQELLAEANVAEANDGVWRASTTQGVRTLQERAGLPATGVVDPATWKLLAEAAPKKARELEQVAAFLETVMDRRNYQCARYDGDFQGTEVGMTLFYTDLVMKLWAFSNKVQAPPIEGFVPETTFDISPMYWENIEHNSETRSWLSGRLDSVTMQDNGTTLFFAPVATRIYNASSNPLYPGKEVAANYMSERFSTWWNFHYRQVADYEPQYHRLNQLMKWSAILQSLGSRSPALLARLKAPTAPRNLRFDSWWQSRSDLKVHWKLEFLSRADEPTECLARVESDAFDVTGGVSTLSGGVSLFDRGKLIAKAALDKARLAIADPRLRIAAGDFRELTPGAKALEVPLANGDKLIRAGVGGFEFKPATGALTGARSALASPSVGWRVEGAEEGMRLALTESKVPLARMAIETEGKGLAVRVEQSTVTSAARLLGGAGQADSPAATALNDMIPVRLANGEVWVRSVKNREWAFARTITDGEAAKSGVRISWGGGTALVQAGDGAALDKIAGGWLRVGSLPGRPAQLITESVMATPTGAKPFVLETSAGRIEGVLHEGAWYASRGTAGLGEVLDRVVQMKASLPAGGVEALEEIGNARAEAVMWRGLDGRRVIGRFTGGSANELEQFEDWLPTSGDGVRGIILANESSAIVKLTQTGFLQLPKGADAATIDLGRRVAQLTTRHPAFAMELYRLSAIRPRDLSWIESLSESRAISYVHMRELPPSEMRGVTLAETAFTAEDPRVLIRAGDEVVSFEVPNAKAVLQARAAAEEAMAGEGLARQWSIATFRQKTRPYFEFVEQVRKRSGGRSVVSLEGDGKLNMETLYRMHGGDSKFRVYRDIPNVGLSVQHVAAPPVLRLERSVVLSTVALDADRAPEFADTRQQLATLRARLVDVRAPITSRQFFDILRDPDASQITLIARCRDDGLVFADRWVSTKALAERVTRTKPKDFLHLVTNCGMGVVHAFADTGRFSRVLSTSFRAGNPSSLAQALLRVTQLTTSAVTSTTATWMQEEFDRARTALPDLRGVLESTSTARGGHVEIDGSGLLRQLVQQGTDLASPVVRGLMEAVRARVAQVPNLTLDHALDRVLENVGRGRELGLRNASMELMGVTQAKYE